MLRTISQGVKNPGALTFDGSGNLYVANSYGGTVTVYAPGSNSVLRTISVSDPTALALDRSSDLYISNHIRDSHFHRDFSSVVVYDPESNKLLRTISQGVKIPQALAFGP